MSQSATNALELILLQCAATAPEPWYPKSFAIATNTSRDSLDTPLERLRNAGLVELTEWVQGHGQGYVLTPDGARLLRNPREMARLQAGELPLRREQPDEPEPTPSRMTPYERGEAVRQTLMGPFTPRVTYLLLMANVAVFLAGAMLAQQAGVMNNYLSGGTPRIAHQLGAVRAVDVWAGQWWRLITCGFVHFGMLHILFNMINLYVLGPLVERMFGSIRFLILYLVAGIAGSAAMTISLAGGGIGAGASASIWGLMTAVVAWVLCNRGHLPRDFVSGSLRQLGSALLLNLLISFMPGISAAGHFGGGIAGFVAGILLNYHRYGRIFVLRLLALTLVLFSPAAIVYGLPTAYRVYLDWRRGNVLGQHLLAGRDGEDWKDVRLPAARKLQLAAWPQFDDKVGPVLVKHWRRRDPAELKDALEALNRGVSTLEEALRVVSTAGPYRTEKVEEQRQAALESLAAQRAYLFECQRCLEQGEGWTDKQERELLELAKASRKARDRFSELLNWTPERQR
jgi:rhomboid protease GluP